MPAPRLLQPPWRAQGHRVLLSAPCLIGESFILGGLVPLCRCDAPCTPHTHLHATLPSCPLNVRRTALPRAPYPPPLPRPASRLFPRPQPAGSACGRTWCTRARRRACRRASGASWPRTSKPSTAPSRMWRSRCCSTSRCAAPRPSPCASPTTLNTAACFRRLRRLQTRKTPRRLGAATKPPRRKASNPAQRRTTS